MENQVKTITDITELKQSEEALIKNRNMLQTLLDHFPGIVFWKDRKSIYLGCNQAFALRAGLKSPSEIVGKTDFDLPWDNIEGEHYLTDDRSVMESGKQKSHIIETLHQNNGKVVWYDTNKIPLLDSLGEVIGVIGVSIDISILKSAEQELILANKELLFQNLEKEKRVAELIIANKELLFQNQENEKRSLELIILKEKAEESDRLKTAFLNNISHEIRTPFNSILGLLSILQDDDVSISERDNFTEIINQNARRLINSIDEIVEISLIQAGQIEFASSETNIDNLIEELRTQFLAYSKSKKLEFFIINKLTKHQSKFSTDTIKLKTILSHLIGNAFKFTQCGSVELVICKKDEYLEFAVKDTGIGIPQNKLEVIFDRFMQTDVSVTREFQGLGLGLTIAKSYVKMLGGKIRVESELGKGSTFYFTIRHNA